MQDSTWASAKTLRATPVVKNVWPIDLWTYGDLFLVRYLEEKEQEGGTFIKPPGKPIVQSQALAMLHWGWKLAGCVHSVALLSSHGDIAQGQDPEDFDAITVQCQAFEIWTG